jgi:hypothetical protein
MTPTPVWFVVALFFRQIILAHKYVLAKTAAGCIRHYHYNPSTPRCH